MVLPVSLMAQMLKAQKTLFPTPSRKSWTRPRLFGVFFTHTLLSASLALIGALSCALSGCGVSLVESSFRIGVTSLSTDPAKVTVSVGAPSLSHAGGSVSITYSVAFSGGKGDLSYHLRDEDVILVTTGSATCTKSISNGTSANPTITLSNCTGEGSVGITISAAVATDSLGLPSEEASASTPLNVDNTAPTVAVSLGNEQSASASATPISFAIHFSEVIDPTSFTPSDITQGGTAQVGSWEIFDLGDHQNFVVQAVTVLNSGSVFPNFATGQVLDPAGNGSVARTNSAYAVAFTDSEVSVGFESGSSIVAEENSSTLQSFKVTMTSDEPKTLRRRGGLCRNRSLKFLSSHWVQSQLTNGNHSCGPSLRGL